MIWHRLILLKVSELLFCAVHRLCFPLVSIGKKHIATNAASIKAPDAKTGALGSTLPAWTATIGAHSPQIRFKHEAIPVPVPLFGAGKTSGVLDLFRKYLSGNNINRHLLRVQNPVHYVLEEGLQACHSELKIWL